MRRLLDSIYRSRVAGAVFHTLVHCLQRELADCESVLDLGCGPSSPVQHCDGLRRTVGVEPFEAYYESAVAAKTHSEILKMMILDLDFPPKSFDAVVLIEVIEHLEERESLRVLDMAERWARKKVIVTSPNGFVAQEMLDGNPLQAHLSGWPLRKMRALGYRSFGLAGLKVLRREAHQESMVEGDLFASIRLRPRPFWFVIATISQIVTYFVPVLAFGLFSVKNRGERISEGIPEKGRA